MTINCVLVRRRCGWLGFLGTPSAQKRNSYHLIRTSYVLAVVLALIFAQNGSAQGKKGPNRGSISDAPSAPADVPEWIDAHVHLRPGKNMLFGPAVKSAADSMEIAHINKIVLEPQPFPDADSNGRNVYDYEGFVRPIQNFPHRFAFLGGNYLNQMLAGTPADAVTESIRAEFEKRAEAVLQAGAEGFGEIGVTHLSRMQGHPYQNIPGDHPLMLLLADIAARYGKLIDIHMDVFDEDAAPPAPISPNPSVVKKNTDGLERLLAHNRNAKIVLAHFGSDYTGRWSPELARRLLARNFNLHFSIKLSPLFSTNQPFTLFGGVKQDWIQLLSDFPDRFVMGTDSFFSPPAAKQSQFDPKPVYKFLAGLPDGLRTKIAKENAERLYGLK